MARLRSELSHIKHNKSLEPTNTKSEEREVMIIIDGKAYIEKSTDDLPFGNFCRECAFYRTTCYNRDDFSCHSDSRPDGKEVIFVRERKM